MEIETLNAMNEGMYLSLMMIKVIMLITVLFAITGFAIYLAGIAWFCFEETRRSTTAPPAPRPASPSNRGSQRYACSTRKRTPLINKLRTDQCKTQAAKA